MSWESYLDRLVRHNPELAGDGRITLSIPELRRILRRAYEAGDGDSQSVPSHPSKSFDFLNGLFNQ